MLTDTSQIGIGTGDVKLKEEEEFQHENYDRIRSMGEEGVGENQARDRWEIGRVKDIDRGIIKN